MKNLNFCYIIDDNKLFFDLLKKSLYSLVKYYDNIGTIYILSSSVINDENKNNLISICKDNKLIIKNIDINITNCIKYPEEAETANRISRIALLKFFIPYLVDCDDIIYVDCDILFYKNASEELIKYIDDTLLIKIYTVDSIINSGIIYINCELWRNKKDIIKDIINYYNLDYIKRIFVDQSCFIYLITYLYRDDCLIDTHEHINIYKSDELDISINYDFFIYHAIGDNKKRFFDIFNLFIKDI